MREFLVLPWQKVSYDPGLGFFVCLFVPLLWEDIFLFSSSSHSGSSPVS